MPAIPAHQKRRKEFQEILNRWVEFYKEHLRRILRYDIKKFDVRPSDVAKALDVSEEYVRREFGDLWEGKK